MYNDITEEYITALAKKVYDKLPVKPEPDKEDNKVLEEGNSQCLPKEIWSSTSA